jgi:hypothetical protein
MTDGMEIERLRLTAEHLERIIACAEGYAEMGAITAHALGQFEHERRWLDMLHILDGSA